jgi:predicted RNA-binding Zn-ribbon protein involved in translation (DUF1610 family)
MSECCPSCGRGTLGATIVEIPHAVTDETSYGAICPDCGTVYRSEDAEAQLDTL